MTHFRDMTIEQVEAKRDYWAGVVSVLERKYDTADYMILLAREKLEYWECILHDMYQVTDGNGDELTQPDAAPLNSARIEAENARNADSDDMPARQSKDAQ